jgi:hypothetical protein
VPVACADSSPSAQPATAVLKSALLLTEYLSPSLETRSHVKLSNTTVRQLCRRGRFDTSSHRLHACEQGCNRGNVARRRPQAGDHHRKGSIRGLAAKAVCRSHAFLSAGGVRVFIDLDVPARRDGATPTSHLTCQKRRDTFALRRRATSNSLSRQTVLRSEPVACGPGQSFSTRQHSQLCTLLSDRLPSLKPIKHRRVVHITKCRDMMKQRSPPSVRAATSAASNQQAP